jgi:uncharacterized protein (DUF4415 family)
MKRRPKPSRPTPDNPEWTERTVSRARPGHAALPKIFGSSVAKKMLRPRGRPKSGNARTAISIRLPPETLARWKATGPGWQTRMAETLAKAIGSKSL